MKRIAALTAVGLLLSTAAVAGEGKTTWIQLPPVCDDSAEALEERRAAELKSCRTTEEGEKADADAIDRCMEDQGWTAASKKTVETYERFCGIVRLLSQTDDDPAVVAHVPNPLSK